MVEASHLISFESSRAIFGGAARLIVLEHGTKFLRDQEADLRKREGGRLFFPRVEFRR